MEQNMCENIETIWSGVVDGAERETGVDCGRFRRAKFHVSDGVRSTENIPVQNPDFMTVPGLEDKPWWNIEDFDPVMQGFLTRMEVLFGEYQAEFENNMGSVTFGEGAATFYFGANEGWKIFLFYGNEAEEVPGASKVFPKIAALLREMRDANYIAKSHFSVLKAGGSIPVHCGGVNHKLRLHYGLRIPDGDIAIKVGGDTRHWENGEVLLFDDTFPHEVWNNTPHDRYILHCRIQHPGLSADERRVSYALESKLFRALERNKSGQ
jgi:hypothetical protein